MHRYCLMRICHIKLRGKTLKKYYNHEICFRHKRKGIYISCVCANACPPLFAEKSRGCNGIEMKTARKVCRARGPTDQKWRPRHSRCGETLHCTTLLRYKQRLYCIWSGVPAGAENALRYKRHYVISDFAMSDNFFVTQIRILTGTKNSLRYIKHLVVSDFVISGFDCTSKKKKKKKM